MGILSLNATTAVLLTASLLLGAPGQAHADMWKKAWKEIERAGGDVRDETKRAGRRLDDKILQPTGDALEGVAVGAVTLVDGVVDLTFKGSVIGISHDLLIQGDSLERAMDELTRDTKSGLRKVVNAPGVATVSVIGAGGDMVDGVAGHVAGDIFKAGTLPVAIASVLPGTFVDLVLEVSDGGDVGDARGIPLDAAIRQAHTYYEPRSKPLPEQVKTMLAPHFSEEILRDARYAVDGHGGSIAGIINGLRTNIGDAKGANHAVTINNIIVFDREPKGVEDLDFWAHEMQHVVQYAERGILGFATDYTKNASALEDEADRVAGEVVNRTVAYLAALGISVKTDAGS